MITAKINQLYVPDLNNKYFKSVKAQNYSFQQPLISYFLKNASGKILRKLHSTCKQMVTLRKVTICRKLDISSNMTMLYYQKEKISLTPQDFDSNAWRKIFVYGGLKFVDANDVKALSTMISKYLYRCEVEHIYIENQEFSKSDFKFLASQKTTTISLINCNIKDSIFVESLDKQQISQLLNNYENLTTFYYIKYDSDRKRCQVCRTFTSFCKWHRKTSRPQWDKWHYHPCCPWC